MLRQVDRRPKVLRLPIAGPDMGASCCRQILSDESATDPADLKSHVAALAAAQQRWEKAFCCGANLSGRAHAIRFEVGSAVSLIRRNLGGVARCVARRQASRLRFLS